MTRLAKLKLAAASSATTNNSLARLALQAESPALSSQTLTGLGEAAAPTPQTLTGPGEAAAPPPPRL